MTKQFFFVTNRYIEKVTPPIKNVE